MLIFSSGRDPVLWIQLETREQAVGCVSVAFLSVSALQMSWRLRRGGFRLHMRMLRSQKLRAAL